MSQFQASYGSSRLPALAALAMRPLPLLPLEMASAMLLRRICRTHPEIFNRLGAHAHKRFGIRPVDLPFAFVLEPAPPRPRVAVVRDLSMRLDARIEASLLSLLRLVEGRLDGDALLFSRELTIAGDVEAVLALRNAIDDAQLDLVREIADGCGPFGRALERVVRAAETLLPGVPDSLRREAR